MNKAKNLFFIVALLVLLLGVSMVSASDVSNDTAQKLEKDTTTSVQGVDTPIKNIKKEEQATDLYVSDNTGSDDNSGTNESPYKTIQKALDQTIGDYTYNIHIAEGTYKGLGNTNLTVNGNYTINFIGEGINKTVFDGEASYRFNDAGGFFWGSSRFWESYLDCTGNWIMNITEGTGLITVRDMTIQSCMNTGGASISGYKTSSINNYGNTYIDTVYFKDNMGGVGAATRNRENATLYINNSIFEGNRKADSMGNYGAALYNNGTAIMENSLIFNNYARWGTVTSDRNLTIINCTIRDNIGYDGGSTYKYGAGVAVDTTLSAGEHIDPLGEMTTVIKNSTLINNQMTDLYVGNSSLSVDGCTFMYGSGIYIAQGEDNRVVQNITNSRFINMTASTISTSLSVKSGVVNIINQVGSYNLNIDNNTFLPYKDDIGTKTALHLNTNSLVTNNNITGEVALGSQNKIYNNTINGAVSGGDSVRSSEVVGNWIHSTVCYGDKAVVLNRRFNIVENNTPNIGQQYNITEENYADYFDNDGVMVADSIEDGSTVYLGNLKNHDITIKSKNIEISASEESVLENVTFAVTDNSIISMNGLTIHNNAQKDYIILLDSSDNMVIGCTINTTTVNTPILINEKYNAIRNCLLNINYSSEDSDEIIGIDIRSDNSVIGDNIINIHSDSNAIAVIKVFNTEKTYLNRNNIKVDSNNMIKGVLADNTIKSTFTDVNFTSNTTGNIEVLKINNCEDMTLSLICNVTTTGNVTGINVQADDKKENIKIGSTTGTIHADNVVGVIFNNTNNNTIQYISNPWNITANHATAYHFDNMNNTSFQCNLNMFVTDNDSVVLKLENSNNNIISPKVNTNINQQILLNNSHNNTISPVNQVVESDYTPMLLYNSDNNTISNLNITTTESNDCIVLDNSNYNRIFNNNLKSKEKVGDSTIKEISSSNNNIEYNSGYVLITMDNYDEHFMEETFATMEIGTIEIGSDFYDKNFIFNGRYNITNPNNYILYNATVTLNGEQSSIFNIRINTTNTTTALYVNTTNFIMKNSSIFHENDNITRTMVLTNNVNAMIYGSNVTTIGPEMPTPDGLPSTIAIYDNSNRTQFNITDLGDSEPKYYNYINVTSNRNEEGSIVAYYSDENGYLFYAKGNQNRINYIYYYGEYIALPIVNMKGNNATAYYLNKKVLYSQSEGGRGELVCTFDSDPSNILVLKNSENNKINALNITTDQRYTMILENVSNSNISSNNLNSSYNKFGDDTILEINGTNNLLYNNGPFEYFVTDENFHRYFDQTGHFNASEYATTISIVLDSDIYNKDFIFDNTNATVTFRNNGNYTIYNGSVTHDKKKLYITNIYFNSTDNHEYIIKVNGIAHTIISNCTIYHSATSEINTILIQNSVKSEQSQIINNTITVEGPEFDSNTGIPTSIAIYYTSNILIQNNIISMYSNTNENGSLCAIRCNYSAVGGGGSISKNTFVINAYSNAIIVSGYHPTFLENNITINSQNDINVFNISIGTTMMGIMKGNIINTNASNHTAILKILDISMMRQNQMMENIMNIKSDSVSLIHYKSTGMGPQVFTGNTVNITSRNINILTSTGAKLLFSSNDIELNGENITVNQLYNSSRDVNYANNNINITSANLPAVFVGDKNTGSNTIKNNTIIIKGNYTQNDTVIQLTNSKATITDNYILTKYLVGNDAIENNTGLTIANNAPTGNKDLEATIIVEPVEITVGKSATISTYIINTLDNPVNEGKVYFKVNGKVLRDTDTGKILYADVADGQAQTTIADTARWDEDTLIQAVFVGQKQYADATSEAVNPTITYPEAEEPEFSVADTTAVAGSEVTITVTTKNLDEGKVVLKVNGKTVKADDGKLYAKVSGDQVTFTYTVPKTYKAGEYSIKAVYTSGTAKLECEGVLVVE